MPGLDTGATVSHYRLLRRLGAGGMGEVFLAYDSSLDRQVAIKFLIAPDDGHGRRRVLREARAIAALNHPDICGVFEVGTDPVGGDFIVMQYLEGESLAVRLRRGRLAAPEALAIATRIADALREAHGAGIVHRDLKPQNIILTTGGASKLLDFGLASRLPPADVGADAETASVLSGPHAVMGTPSYMSPEQVRGQPADARSDVFALGCVLYECLTGQRAFSGPTTADIHAQVLHVDPPPPSSIATDLEPAHDALCARMLQKDGAERLQSAEEVLGAIRTITGSSRSSGPSGPAAAAVADNPAWRRVRRTAAAGLVGAGILAAGWGLWNQFGGPRLPAPTPEAMRWYARGVEALREGSYAGARASLLEATKADPHFVLAFCRLAEASAELDDDRDAQESLLRVSDLVPDRNGLGTDDRLRLDAAQASVLRNLDQAVAAYGRIAARAPDDVGAWIDLGRANEAAERPAEARAAYERALAVDRDSGAAHVRLGVLQSVAGQASDAAASFDEAIRLYRLTANPEGESEALLRKGYARSTVNDLPAARDLLEQAMAVARDPLFVSQRVRAQFELARVTLLEGKTADAEEAARQAVEEARGASLDTLAAGGLVDLAVVYVQTGAYDQADATLSQSIELATARGAVRTRMRAQLERASLRLQQRQPREALALAEEPMKFYSEGRYVHMELIALNVESRAQGDLEHGEEGSRLAAEALRLGRSIGDDSAVATALENLVGILTDMGRLPEALGYRAQIEAIYRKQGATGLLAYDLLAHADLLIQMGRVREAEVKLDEFDAGVAGGVDAFRARAPRLAFLRALAAVVTSRYDDVPRLTAGLIVPGAKPSSSSTFARVLSEYARSKLGTSTTAPQVIASWPAVTSNPSTSAELTYWCSQTLLARHDAGLAYSIAAKALDALQGRDNPELVWRLAAIAEVAKPGAVDEQTGGSMRARAAATLSQLGDLWGRDFDSYMVRSDLKALRDLVR